jgi:hypothetical protein
MAHSKRALLVLLGGLIAAGQTAAADGKVPASRRIESLTPSVELDATTLKDWEIRQIIVRVDESVRQMDVRDPPSQPVRELPGLAIPYMLVDELHRLSSSRTLKELKPRLSDWTRRATEMRQQKVSLEILRLPDEQVRLVAKEFHLPLTFDEARSRRYLYEVYKEGLRRFVHEPLLARAREASSLPELASYLNEVGESVGRDSDQKGLRKREIVSKPFRKLAKKVADKEFAKIKRLAEDRRRGPRTFTLYQPLEPLPPGRAVKDMSEGELIRYYAPRILQAEEPAEARTYDADFDRFGHLRLEQKGPSELIVRSDVSVPVLYTYAREALIGAWFYRQISYEFYYPEHPSMFPRDLEAGPLDGRFLTITLDGENRPILYESAMSCGCYHEIYVTRHTEALARSAAGHRPHDGKHYSAGRRRPQDSQLVIKGVVDEGRTATLGLDAGFHLLESFNTGPVPKQKGKLKVKTYELRDGESLELLRYGDRYVSIYRRDGMIKGGERPESNLLWLAYPALHAPGWSRHPWVRRWGFEPESAGSHNPAFLAEATSVPFKRIPGLRRF